jgi:hypothetical protein
MKILSIALFLLIVNYANSQSIIGLWQEGSPEITDSYLNAYEFKADGTFKFNTNGYFGLSRVVSLCGKYKVVGKEIELTVEYTLERIGGNIERSTFAGTATHLWVIEGGQLKKIILNKPVKSVIHFEFAKPKKADGAKTQMVLLDKYEFYKINPD